MPFRNRPKVTERGEMFAGTVVLVVTQPVGFFYPQVTFCLLRSFPSRHRDDSHPVGVMGKTQIRTHMGDRRGWTAASPRGRMFSPCHVERQRNVHGVVHLEVGALGSVPGIGNVEFLLAGVPMPPGMANATTKKA